jgi:bifunctional UDP-N-acetylglucosamine pyrophosphorylase / glucosamine-1-phosphate N-acetyltransferase
VGPGCVLRDTTVAPDATVQFAVCESAEIGSGASVGPFAFLRPGTRVGAGAGVGAYVELKNASVGEGRTVGHLSYLGDADIGGYTSVGAATMVANSGAAARHHSAVGVSAAAAARARATAPGGPPAGLPADHDEPDHDEPENDEGVQGT